MDEIVQLSQRKISTFAAFPCQRIHYNLHSKSTYMKIRLAISLFLLFIGLLTLPGNKNGRASQSGKGNTGAPGDQTLNGLAYTCTGCHDDGAFNPNISITVLDTGEMAITHYMPGKLYTARVSINASGTGLSGYGFQMIALRDTGNVDLDGFSDINPNNYKIATISNGRTYAEHANVSASNTFNVRWTAPVAGTGSVTFYASGNAVNGNGNSSGDGGAVTSLHLDEEITLSSGEVDASEPSIRIFPNPVTDVASVTCALPNSGEYQLSAYNMAGKKVWSMTQIFPSGNNNYQIPTEKWPTGAYFISISSEKWSKIVKILKL